MSLISEALRKAQLEAVRQDRDERRYYMNHAGRGQSASSSGNRTVAVIAILGGLCFVAGAALFYLSVRSAPSAPVLVHEPSARASVVQPPAATVAPAVTQAPAQKAIDEPAQKEISRTVPAKEEKRRLEREKQRTIAPAVPRERGERPRTSAAEPEVVRETPARSASIVIGEPRRTPAPRRNSRDGFIQGETYGSPVLGPFGTEVTLTGITALGGQFVAIINGSTVRAGSAIGPFVIEEIEARRVRLRYVDVSFFVVQ